MFALPIPQKSLGILGFCQDIGASRRGVDMGPFAIRAERLEAALSAMGHSVKDFGNIHCISMDDEAKFGTGFRGEKNLRYLEPMLKNLTELRDRVAEICGEHRIPVVLGGDHSLAMGSVAGLQKSLGNQMGLLWIDAHGDFNTPTSTESGNIHGMPLAVLTGRGEKRLVELGPFPGVREENICLFGVRDLDRMEVENLRDSKVCVITMRDIIEDGFRFCVDKALDVVCRGGANVHVSFDMDSIDPTHCPGTGTSVPGGLIDREALYLMERVFETDRLASLDVVEVNPALDVGNKTARFAVDLICRAFGYRGY